MKRCPKCNLNYPDETLDFCLEDGAKLIPGNKFETETPTVTRSNKQFSETTKTLGLPFPVPEKIAGLRDEPPDQPIRQTTLLKEKALEKGSKILEIAPLVIALAHNWWQWIYLANQYYSSLTNYVASANFLVWLLLLILGVTLGLVSLKRVRNRGFAIAGLITIAINLILFLVPKR